MLDASVVDNVALSSLQRFVGARLPFVRRREMRHAVDDIAASLRIKTDAPARQPVETLSGGNQQKAVLGKWLLTAPSVFLMDEPTRGIDVGAKYEVYALINDLAAQGAGILCISSEVEELMGLCDRILVMHRGEVRWAHTHPFHQENILRDAFGEGGGVG